MTILARGNNILTDEKAVANQRSVLILGTFCKFTFRSAPLAIVCFELHGLAAAFAVYKRNLINVAFIHDIVMGKHFISNSAFSNLTV